MTTATQTMPEEVDVVVIGAGPVGENAAQYAVEGGLTALMVEEDLVGGECSYHACMPSKALLRPLDVAGASEHLPGLRPARVDPDALLARRDDWVSHYDDSGQAEWADGAGIGLARGHGHLAGEREVSVDGLGRVRARTAVVIATGSEPVVPDALAAVQPWTSADATGVREVPERLLIVGGGVVAVEAATWMAGLGARVTVLARGAALLSRFEEGVGAAVAEGLHAAGVEVVLGAEVQSAERDSARSAGLGRIHGGPVRVVAGGRSFEAEEVLAATGRRPRLGGVGLDAVGLSAEDVARGAVPSWLHVIGDAGTGAPLTHMGKYEARVLGSRLAGAQEHVPEGEPVVPQVVFTSPQVATVGLTQSAAEDAGHDVVVSRVPYTAAAGASLLRDDAAGLAALVVERESGLVLGATFVGPDSAELVHAATVAVVGRVPVRVLRHAVPSYPTASELWLRLLEDLPRELR